MKNYYSSMKLESGVKIFVVGKAGSNDAISSSLLYQSFYIDVFFLFLTLMQTYAPAASASWMTALVQTLPT